ncbi:hypothetical protein T484DRAFT_1818511 [Baffinella frigidus]|nr:hypothetical protein T484DRAFT_1818511 [Cryptophyta sp. CCMP2293]
MLDDDVLDCFKCPITCEMFVDPVCASDGYTYERADIELYMSSQKINQRPFTSPMDSDTILSTNMYTNMKMKAAVAAYKDGLLVIGNESRN